jgi:hypothetical protein
LGGDNLNGLRTRLIAKTQDRNGDDFSCLRFLYYIRGNEAVKLNVLVKGASGAINSTGWTRFRDYGEEWNRAELTIKSTENYQTVFEADASLAQTWLGLIALNDVYTVKGACPPSGFCDFDNKLQACAWFNIEGLI